MVDRGLNIFPVVFVPGIGYVVGAMVSQSYGPKYGDPRRSHSAIVPPDMIDHQEIHEWLAGTPKGPASVTMLGGPRHGPTHNKPTTLFVQFGYDSDRRAFGEEFGF